MPSPTVVLIHGAFADGSTWRAVFDRLNREGHTVLAPPNPLRGLAYDSSYTTSLLDQLDGPVLLVGHSYGGAVITVAGDSDKVAGLVYVAGIAPDEGESVNDLQGRFPALAMGPLIEPTQLSDGSVVASIDPAQFHEVFAADVRGGRSHRGRSSAPRIAPSPLRSTGSPTSAPVRRSPRSRVPRTS